MKKIWLGLMALLSGCSDDRAAAPSADQSQQLDEVDAMLNAEAPEQKGPAPQGADPFDR